MSNQILSIKTFDQLSVEQLYEILKARFAVFVMEQRCFYLDMDDIDYDSFHIVISESSKVVAYARLFLESSPDVWHIGRVLTTRRREGFGKRVMMAAIDKARQMGATMINIDAQVHATEFYEQLGFVVCSEPFYEAEILHVKMQLPLPKA